MADHYSFEDVEVDVQGFRVFKAGKAVPLEPKSLQVLVFLVENRGRLVEKSEILNAVWGDAFVTENVLSRAIAQLRKALADDAKDARYIETVPTRGYRFIATVDVTEPQSPGGKSFSAAPTQEKKNRAWLYRSLLALPVMACLIVGSFAVVRWLSGSRYLQVLNTTQITTSSGLSMHPTFSPDGKAMAYSADHGKGFEIFVRQLAPGGKEIQITADGGQNMQPAWSPDGSLIAYASRVRGGIWLIPALGGTSRQLVQSGAHPAWSYDGQWIAYQSAPRNDLGAQNTGVFPPSTVWVIRPDGSGARQVTHPGSPEGGHGAPSWSPDGKHLVFVSGSYRGSEVWAIGIDGTGLVCLAPFARGHYDPVYAPDGQSVLWGGVKGGSDYALWQARVSPQTSVLLEPPVQITNTAGIIVKNLAISGDGKKLLYSGQIQTSILESLPLSAAGAPSGEPVALMSNSGCRTSLPAFSPDGSRLALCTCRGGLTGEIWLMNVDGTNLEQLTTSPPDFEAVAPTWYPDSRRVLFLRAPAKGPSALYSVDIETRRPVRVADLDQDISRFELSPDGTQLVFASSVRGVINLWLMDMANGKPRQLTFDKEMVGFPAWSRDGKFIAAEVRRGEDTNIAVISSGGGPLTQLTFGHGEHWLYSWTPDGDKILFAAQPPNGIWNLWSVSRSTGAQLQLTHYTKPNSFVRYPAASPRGNQIVYEYSESSGNIWMMEFK